MQEEKERMLSAGKTRIEKWDLLRALLIFLVVLGHLVDYYVGGGSAQMRGLFLFIYSFHMPCFLFVDGLFSKHNVDEKRYNHIFSYLVLYLALKILICLVDGLIKHQFSFSLLGADGAPWYGLALFWCSLMTIFLKRFSHKWVLIGAVLLACFAGYDGDVDATMVLSRTIVFFPFFFAGYCLDPAKVAEKLSGKWVRALGLAVLVLLGVVCFCCTDDIYFVRALLTGKNPYRTLETGYGREELVFYGWLLRLGYYAVVAVLCMAVMAVIPNHLRHGKALTAVGRRTLQIYMLNRPAIYILFDGLGLHTALTAMGADDLVVLPLAVLLTAVLALPFWERPIRAVIYPKLQEPGPDTKG
ncbi:MAG: acyltransferase family protein [Clostridiales bacterium]|nr:acyltransferase family protein [Clostridiales bacterium]